MARGTRRDPKMEELWRRRLRAQSGSGLSVRAWCRRHGQRDSAFYWWRAQLARRDSQTPPIVPVRVVPDTAPEAAGRIGIVLPGDRRVHIVGHVERQTLAEVFAALAASAPVAEAPGC